MPSARRRTRTLPPAPSRSSSPTSASKCRKPPPQGVGEPGVAVQAQALVVGRAAQAQVVAGGVAVGDPGPGVVGVGEVLVLRGPQVGEVNRGALEDVEGGDALERHATAAPNTVVPVSVAPSCAGRARSATAGCRPRRPRPPGPSAYGPFGRRASASSVLRATAATWPHLDGHLLLVHLDRRLGGVRARPARPRRCRRCAAGPRCACAAGWRGGGAVAPGRRRGRGRAPTRPPARQRQRRLLAAGQVGVPEVQPLARQAHALGRHAVAVGEDEVRPRRERRPRHVGAAQRQQAVPPPTVLPSAPSAHRPASARDGAGGRVPSLPSAARASNAGARFGRSRQPGRRAVAAAASCAVPMAMRTPSRLSLLQDRQVVVGHLQDDAGHGGGVVGADLVDPGAVGVAGGPSSSSRMAGYHSVQ